MLKSVTEVILWIIVASLVVLVVMNSFGFVQAVTAVGGVVTGESTILTGSGYKKAS
jgi:hypothetical protein